MIAVGRHGRVSGYNHVGWLAAAATLLAIAFVGRIRMHTGRAAG
jgi:hypothetical protein